MTDQDKIDRKLAGGSKASRWRRGRGVLVLLMGCLAIAAPFLAGSLGLFLVGLLLIVCGVLEMLETFHAPSETRRRSAYLSGALTVITGSLLLAQPHLVLRGLAIFLAGLLLIDGLNKLVVARRSRRTGAPWIGALTGGVVNVALCLVLAIRWPVSGFAIVMVLMGIRMLTTGWSMLMRGDKEVSLAREPSPGGLHPDRRLNLPRHAEFEELEESL